MDLGPKLVRATLNSLPHDTTRYNGYLATSVSRKHDFNLQPDALRLLLRLHITIGDFPIPWLVAAVIQGACRPPVVMAVKRTATPGKQTHHSDKMASLPALRAVLLVALSVFLTVVLGFGLPALLNAFMRMLGLPETSVTECIVALYAVFVLYVATPRIPRGLVEVMSQQTRGLIAGLHFIRQNIEMEHRCQWNVVKCKIKACNSQKILYKIRYSNVGWAI